MKLVIVLDRALPLGLLANAAAVLAFSASRSIPGGVGRDTEDADGEAHAGITQLPIPVLACETGQIKGLRDRARDEGLLCIDFSDVAQRAKNYEDYAAELKSRSGSELAYLGLCIYGESDSVRRLTGNLGLVK